jgi:hypothetical protein
MIWLAPLALISLMQAPSTPLTGVVVGTKGEPIAGAEVILVEVPGVKDWKTPTCFPNVSSAS